MKYKHEYTQTEIDTNININKTDTDIHHFISHHTQAHHFIPHHTHAHHTTSQHITSQPQHKAITSTKQTIKKFRAHHHLALSTCQLSSPSYPVSRYPPASLNHHQAIKLCTFRLLSIDSPVFLFSSSQPRHFSSLNLFSPQLYTHTRLLHNVF